jgi:hypothetical protein
MNAVLQTGDLSGEASAFLVAGNPKPVSGNAAPAATPFVQAAVEDQAKQGKPEMPRLRMKEAAEDEPEAGRVSLTVRVPRLVPPGLLLASVDRKLKRQRPFTQQEIVAEAVTDWLKARGYLS